MPQTHTFFFLLFFYKKMTKPGLKQLSLIFFRMQVLASFAWMSDVIKNIVVYKIFQINILSLKF